MSNWFKEPVNSLGAYLDYLDSRLPGTSRIYFSENSADFAEGVEEAIHAAVCDMERSCKAHRDSPEIQLSSVLRDRLNGAAVPCEAEAYSNGHVDITITHPRHPTLRYLGECKIWNGYSWHYSGCEQLLRRYMTGRETRGFVLEFFTNARMTERLEELQEKFDRLRPLSMIGRVKTHRRIAGGFLTTHEHPAGMKMAILHFGCNLITSTRGPTDGAL